jgi:DNA-binding NtrC family response regulator
LRLKEGLTMISSRLKSELGNLRQSSKGVHAPQALIVGLPSETSTHLAPILRKCGLRPLVSRNVAHSKPLICAHRASAVFCSQEALPEVVRAARATQPKVPVIVVSRDDTWDTYLKALHTGASEYLSDRAEADDVERIIRTTLKRRCWAP